MLLTYGLLLSSWAVTSFLFYFFNHIYMKLYRLSGNHVLMGPFLFSSVFYLSEMAPENSVHGLLPRLYEILCCDLICIIWKILKTLTPSDLTSSASISSSLLSIPCDNWIMSGNYYAMGLYLICSESSVSLSKDYKLISVYLSFHWTVPRIF